MHIQYTQTFFPVLQKFLGSFWRPSLQPSPLSHRDLVPFEDALSSTAWQAHYRAGGGETAQLPTGKSEGKSNVHYSLSHISFYDLIINILKCKVTQNEYSIFSQRTTNSHNIHQSHWFGHLDISSSVETLADLPASVSDKCTDVIVLLHFNSHYQHSYAAISPAPDMLQKSAFESNKYDMMSARVVSRTLLCLILYPQICNQCYHR